MLPINLSILSVTFAVFCCCAMAVAQDPPPQDGPRRDMRGPMQPPMLRVSGNAQTQAAPDHATVRLGAVAQAAEAQQAQEQVNQIMVRALEAVRALGIEEKDVRTADLALFPIHEQPVPQPGRQDQPAEPRIVAYRASNTVVVDLSDLSKIGPVIDACVGVGANQLQGVQFSLQNDLEARTAALEKAVTDARRKAEALARAAGMQLGPIMELSEGGAYVQPPQPLYATRGMAMEMATPTPVQPGQLDIHASVTMVYHLRPAGDGPVNGARMPEPPREGEVPRDRPTTRPRG